MIALLTMTCKCGRRVSAPCPTLADIPTAQAQMPGWGYDERGFVQCPDCRDGVPVPPEKPMRGDLFDEVRA